MDMANPFDKLDEVIQGNFSVLTPASPEIADLTKESFKTVCLICGSQLQTNSDNSPIQHADSHGCDITTLSCFLKLFKVRTNNNVLWCEKPFPFCNSCHEQIKSVQELQKTICDLEQTLVTKKEHIKLNLKNAEGTFQECNIYECDRRYFRIRHHILGGKVVLLPKSKVKSHTLKTHSSPTQTIRRHSNFSKSRIADHHIIDSKEPFFVTCMTEECDNHEEMASPKKEPLDEDEYNCLENANVEVQLNETDPCYEPGSEDEYQHKNDSVVDYSPRNEMDLNDFEFDSDQASEHESTKELITWTSKSSVNIKSYGKTSTKRCFPVSVEEKTTSEINSTTSKDTGKVRKVRGSYNKFKIKVDRKTGNCQYLHIKFEKLDKNRFKCTDCGKTVGSHNTIKNHTIRIHTDKYVCDQCGQHKATQSDLNKHVREVHEGKTRKPPPKTMECSICGKPFGNKVALKLHVGTHYTETDKQEAEAKGDRNLAYLNREHIQGQCGVCGVIFKNITWLRKHEKIKHPSSEQEKSSTQRICTHCGKPVSDAYYPRHVERYHSQIEKDALKPFVCSFCDKRFYTSAKLIEHKRVHTGENPFQCLLCQKVFTAKNQLKYHQMQNHENNKPHSCSLCSATFVRGHHLKRHLLTVHEGRKQSELTTASGTNTGAHPTPAINVKTEPVRASLC